MGISHGGFFVIAQRLGAGLCDLGLLGLVRGGRRLARASDRRTPRGERRFGGLHDEATIHRRLATSGAVPARRRAELVRPTVSLAHGVAATLGTHDAGHPQSPLLGALMAPRLVERFSEKKCFEGK